MSKIKVGLYLQDLTIDPAHQESSFNEAMAAVKESDIDLLVFPEVYYYPFTKRLESVDITNSNELDDFVDDVLMPICNELGHAVIFCGKDMSSGKEAYLYSLFVFPGFENKKYKLHVKHTKCEKSAFQMPEYRIDKQFEPVLYKGFSIGHTICYDSNFPLFSRAYRVRGVNLLINSTGKDVRQKKWARFMKTRAIENDCYSLCTMSHAGESKTNKPYIFAYNKDGGVMKRDTIYKSRFSGLERIDAVVIDDNKQYPIIEDRLFIQDKSENQSEDIFISRTNFDEMLDDGGFESYVLTFPKAEIQVIKTFEQDIMNPEMIQVMMGATDTRVNNAKYIILNHWNELDENTFKAKISIIAQTRSVEFMCPVVVMSPNIFECYQPTLTKDVQILLLKKDGFGLDLRRANGFKSITEFSVKRPKSRLYLNKYYQVIRNILETQMSNSEQ